MTNPTPPDLAPKAAPDAATSIQKSAKAPKQVKGVTEAQVEEFGNTPKAVTELTVGVRLDF